MQTQKTDFQNIFSRLKNHIENKTTDLGASNFQIPTLEYTSDKQYQSERTWFKREVPIALIGAHTLKQVGDYVTKCIFDHPLIILKEQAKIRVFANICQHRAARLLAQEKGHVKQISCPYHAWTYHLDGRLKAMPGKNLAAPNLCMDSIRLIEYPVIVRGGIIWTILQPKNKHTATQLQTAFHSLESDFQLFKFDDHRPLTGFTLDCHFNWKIAVESFLEVYHFSVVHKNSIPAVNYKNIAVMDQLERHGRIILPMNSFEALLGVQECSFDALQQHTNIMYFIFPNNFFLVMRGFYAWIQVIPKGVNQCIMALTLMIPKNTTDENIINNAKMSAEKLQAIISEDIEVCNRLQENLKCEHVKHLNYIKFESMIAHFHKNLKISRQKSTPPWHRILTCRSKL